MHDSIRIRTACYCPATLTGILYTCRNEKYSALLRNGYVPSQNRFIHSVGLRKLLQAYGGVVLGTSAGSVNSADHQNEN